MPGLIHETPFKTLTIRELHPTFGAEVEGVNWYDLSDEQFNEIKAAMAKYGFCVFRKTGLTDDAHVAFSKRLGALDSVERFITGGRKLRYKHFELFDAGNLDENNELVDPDSPRAHAGRGNGLWHVDSSFNPRRASFSLLRAVVIPPAGTGGNTDFADARTAWDDLPEELQADLLAKDYVGAHNLATSRKAGSPEYFRDMDPLESPLSYHRIAQVHEPSGRRVLYVGAHLNHIRGMPDDESAALVARLNAHATQPKYQVSVGWEEPGDMIMWDNRAVMHRAGGGDFEGKHKRDMRRTTVHDDGAQAWGLNRVGTAMPGPTYLKEQIVPVVQPTTVAAPS